MCVAAAAFGVVVPCQAERNCRNRAWFHSKALKKKRKMADSEERSFKVGARVFVKEKGLEGIIR